MKKIKAVVILSGGMDSTLCAYIAKELNYDLITLHFNYGQRTMKKEIEAFENISKRLNVINSYNIDLDFFKQIGASALIDTSIDIPTNGIEDGVPITYVPFRNGIFLSVATAIAEKESAQAIFIGVVQEDSSGYPDCRDEFIEKMSNAMNSGTKAETKVNIITPLVHLTKAEIVKKSIELNVPLELTWSCYQNETEACGICDSCRLRLKGFKEAGVKDLIKYQLPF